MMNLNLGHGYPSVRCDPTEDCAKVFIFSRTILMPRSSEAFSSRMRDLIDLGNNEEEEEEEEEEEDERTEIKEKEVE